MPPPPIAAIWTQLLAVYDRDFPRLRSDGFAFTSPWVERFNCIAWAAQDPTQWWWPGVNLPPGYHWPDGCGDEETIEVLRCGFVQQGYVDCDNPDRIHGMEKVALYALADGTATHAARQLPTGGWTSKLGKNYDIVHKAPESLEGPLYGAVAAYMQRPRPEALLLLAIMCGGQRPEAHAELTVTEASSLLSVSEEALHASIDNGEVPHYLVGPHRRLTLTDVLDHRTALEGTGGSDDAAGLPEA